MRKIIKADIMINDFVKSNDIMSKIIEEIGPDFCSFIEDFLKEILNLLSKIPKNYYDCDENANLITYQVFTELFSCALVTLFIRFELPHEICDNLLDFFKEDILLKLENIK
jgi:hypothetical protein